MTLDPAIVAAIVGAVGAIATAGKMGVWRWGREVEQVEKALEAMTDDRNFWRGIGLKSVGLTDKALDVVVRKARGG